MPELTSQVRLGSCAQFFPSIYGVLRSIVPGATAALAVPLTLIVAACSNSDPDAPAIASAKPAEQTQDRIDTSNLSEAGVAAIAKNRKKMSCIELSTGAAQARSYASASLANATGALAAAESSTSASNTADSAKPPPPSNAQLIDDELICHCDRGNPTAGNELYERRENLMQLAKYPGIRQELITHYPKEKGEPRFLKFGEVLSDDALKKLPVVAPRFQPDTCDRACKDGRAKDNEAAKAQGQPEPWPNLETPKPVGCTADAPLDSKNKTKKTQ